MSAYVELLVKNLDTEDENSFLVSFHIIKSESSYSNRYLKMESNLAAVQEAERVVLGLFGHWVGDFEIAKLFAPHRQTCINIQNVKGNAEEFLKIAMLKYWSTLGSASRNKKLAKAYFFSNESMEQLALVNGLFVEFEDDIEDENPCESSYSDSFILKKKRKIGGFQMTINLKNN